MRGLTTPIQWFDEIAFINHNDIIWEAAAPAYSQASLEAARLNKPRFRVVTTTPNNQDLGAGAFAYKLKDGAAKFMMGLYDMTLKEIENYISSNSENDFLYIVYSWQELGRDIEWYKKQCRALLNNRLKIKRELDLVWPMSSDASFFSEETIESIKIHECKITDHSVNILTKYHLHLSDKFNLDFHKKYLLGLDCATGAARDSSSVVVVDPDTHEPVAYFENNRIDTEDLKKVVVYLMKVIFPNSVLVPERNSVGIAIINHILTTESLKKRVYYYYRPETATEKVHNRIAKATTGEDVRLKIYGIDTTKSTRPVMIENLQLLTNDKPYIFKIPRIIEQIQTLQMKKNGKIEHADSAKDDVLFAYLLVIYALGDPNIHKILNFSSVESSRSINMLTSMNVGRNENEIRTQNIKGRTINFQETLDKQEKSVKKSRTFLNKLISLNS